MRFSGGRRSPDRTSERHEETKVARTDSVAPQRCDLNCSCHCAAMQLTVKYTDVYDGAEYPRTETFDVPAPVGDIEDWAYDHLYSRSGDGRGHGEAGYFAEVIACAERPELENRQFAWGV